MGKNHFLEQIMKQTIHKLLKISALRFAVLFLIIAVTGSVMIVLTIDFLWDGRFNPELEFAGVITPFLDALFIVIFVTAMLDEIRKLNGALEAKVKELLAVQEELVRKEKLATLGQLSGSVGHELRNPLGVMSNAVYYLKTVMPDADETVKEYLDMIKSEINSSERIISDLLNFSRVKTPQTQSITINELVQQSLGKCTVPENVTLRLDLPDTIPELKVDPLQMGQVFQNLIMNAVQAMPEGGELRISARRGIRDQGPGVGEEKLIPGPRSRVPGQAFIEISIADTGAGILPENMVKLFQPLFSTKARGIGLGLTVVKNLVEANSGRIEVESELGKGTTFTVILPIINRERG